MYKGVGLQLEKTALGTFLRTKFSVSSSRGSEANFGSEKLHSLIVFLKGILAAHDVENYI